MSMALLATPSLGLLISACALQEPVNASLLAGVVLTATGIRMTVTITRQGDDVGTIKPSSLS
jgi:hypothetical protein